MFIGIAMFFVLMLMGGLIAFLGDKIGSKVGKKRMTLFGLRPKYTSIIVTIISGVLISFLTVAVLAVVNENVRVALFGLSKLQAQMANLNQEIIVKNKELDEGKKQLEARNKEYEGVTKNWNGWKASVLTCRVNYFLYKMLTRKRRQVSGSLQKK